MRDKIIGWSIVVAALAGIAVFVIVMAAWVNNIINAPDCDGSKQSVCRVVPVAEQKPEVILPPTAEDIEAKLNEFRVAKGLSALNSNVAALDEAARVRADGMCATNDWSHANDWAVLAPYYSYAYAGENLYFGFLQKDQASVAIRDWSNSPSHLENMVGNYTEVGMAVKACPGFQNEPTAIIVTNYFGVPR